MHIQLPITVPLGKGGRALDYFPSGRMFYVRRTLAASKELALLETHEHVKTSANSSSPHVAKGDYECSAGASPSRAGHFRVDTH